MVDRATEKTFIFQWISIKDYMPDEAVDNRILVCSHAGKVDAWRFIEGLWRNAENNWCSIFNIAFWMPYPEPPSVTHLN